MLAKRRRQLSAISGGHAVMARIVSSCSNRKAHLGNDIVWYITCVWTDPATNRDYTFVSAAIWASSDPVRMLEAANVMELPVYIDPDDPGRRYFVDDREASHLAVLRWAGK